MPPEMTATSVRPLMSIFPASTAASATAPPGSATSFNSVKATRIAWRTSSSLTPKPPASRSLFSAKVRRPGIGASKASQIDRASGGTVSRLPLSRERFVSSKSSGSTA